MVRSSGLLIAAGLVLASEARAATHRVAVLVGSNAGNGELRPLAFAEADAGKMARVLAEVGGMSSSDLFLLQGQPRSALEHALGLARERVDLWHRSPADRVLLIFYFSGHSDGQALEIGAERLSFEELRGLLGQTHADVRVAIVDSCSSGALLNAKGGTSSASYDIRLSDDLASTGQILLASSAADEVALESTDLGGSVFTHYLASGLRGAADISGDGRVTLTEAYQYAYQHTLARTAVTRFGAQHPSFDYRLSGQGELVLADLSSETASLELPERFTQAVVNDLRRDQVVAELGEGTGRRLAVDPGEYLVRAAQGGQTFLSRVQIAAGEHRQLTWADLHPIDDPLGQSKGDSLSATYTPPAPPFSLAVLGGALAGVTVGPSWGAAAVLAGAEGFGPRFEVSVGEGRAAPLNETALRGMVGWALGWHPGPLVLYAGPSLGGGLVWQSNGDRSAVGDVAAQAGGSYALGRRVALVAELQVGAELLEERGMVAAVFEPQAWLGIRFGLGD